MALFKTTMIRTKATVPQIENQQDVAAFRPNTPKGDTTIAHILEQTKNILSESGFASISIRSVADRCSLSPGNVTYYFKTKDILLEELAKYIFDRWNLRFYESISRFAGSPRDIFVFSIEYMIKENKRPKTSNMLLEMWAMANHNTAVRNMMDVFYSQMRSWIETLIQDMNPQMSKSTRQKRAALFTAQIEGLMVLIGHGRIPHEELVGLEEAAVAQITHLAFLD